MPKAVFKKKNGFTLIELLAVVAIIGILSALAIPQYSDYRTKAFNTAAKSDVMNFKLAMIASNIANGSYPVFD